MGSRSSKVAPGGAGAAGAPAVEYKSRVPSETPAFQMFVIEPGGRLGRPIFENKATNDRIAQWEKRAHNAKNPRQRQQLELDLTKRIAELDAESDHFRARFHMIDARYVARRDAYDSMAAAYQEIANDTGTFGVSAREDMEKLRKEAELIRVHRDETNSEYSDVIKESNALRMMRNMLDPAIRQLLDLDWDL
jgi:hypothetical protein